MAIKKRKSRARRKVKTRAKGAANQVAGAAQGVYGQAANVTRNGAAKLDQWSRSAIETQPYTSALAVFGAGWLLGEIGGFLAGRTQGIGGRVGRNIQGIGWLIGRNIQSRVANQVAGATKDVYGQAANATRNGAINLDQWSRSAIETQPYTSALIALGTGGVLGGIGWLLGRMNRSM
jgi:uncharacterized protein YjbJ (UPF0337 family)